MKIHNVFPLLGLFLLVSSLLTGCGGGSKSTTATGQDAFMTIDGVRRHYIDYGGRGQTVLLLSGLGDNAHIFDDLAPRLTDKYRVIALTRRGSGRSDKPADGYTLDTLTDDIKNFLDRMGISGKVHLAGHSIAGIELTRFAARFPERVSKLVYLDAVYDYTLAADAEPPQLPPGVTEEDVNTLIAPEPTPEDGASLESAIAFQRGQHSVWSRAMENSFRDSVEVLSDGSVRPRTGDEITQQMLATAQQYKPEWDKITVPALVLVPIPGRIEQIFPYLPESITDTVRLLAELVLEGDVSSKRVQSGEFRQKVANVQVVEIPDAEHYVFVQYLDETVRLMRDFL